MHLEDQIKEIRDQNRVLTDLVKQLLVKVDLLSKNKLSKDKFKEQESEFLTVKEVAYYAKVSERTVWKYLSEYEGEIRSQKVEGKNQLFVHYQEWLAAKKRGRKDFNREVFNGPKQQKAA